MSENELNIVGPTEFEELCNEVAKRNAVRDKHLLVLKEIMTAYEYMRCQLKMEYLSVSWQRIDCVIKGGSLQTKTRTISKSWPSYKHYHNISSVDHLGYFLSKIEKEYFAEAQPPASKYGNTFFLNRSYLLHQSMLFSDVDLEENIWDPENQRIDPEKLKNFVAKYTWAFPPNTQELLDEKLREEKNASN